MKPTKVTTKALHEDYREALTFLQAGNFAVKPLWIDLEGRIAAAERGLPDEYDTRYTVPMEAPSLDGHLVGGKDGVRTLSAHALWGGYHYALTPGQRQWFRENTAMPPCTTVTVPWVEVWPDTRHPRSFKVCADVHIGKRKVQAEMVIRKAGRFFAEAAAHDAELAKPKVTELNPVSLVLGGYYTLETYQKWALNDLCDGLIPKKFEAKVQCTALSDDRVRFEDCVSGVSANVVKSDLFALFDDYAKLPTNWGQGPSRGRGRGQSKVTEGKIIDYDVLLTDLETDAK